MTTATTPAPPAAETALAMLQALGTELVRAGLRSRLNPQVPYLTVTSPAAADLSERVRAVPDAAGAWHFWWSWGEPIAAAVPEAAAAIRRVLRTATATP
jgi:hypothetical protein